MFGIKAMKLPPVKLPKSPLNKLKHSDTAYFIRNVYRLRKSLWNFRAFDYGFNLDLFCESLKITRDFLSSDKTTVEDAYESAREIDAFLKMIKDYRNSIDVAKTQIGFITIDYDFETMWNREITEEERNLYKLANEIETERWSSAWKHISNRMQHWWD